MQKYTDIVLANGLPYSGATIEVLYASSGIAAPIYSDNGITLISGNTVTSDTNGRFFFYAADGRYTIRVTGTGVTTQEISDILLEDPATPSTGAFTTLVASGTDQTVLNTVSTDASTYAIQALYSPAVAGDTLFHRFATDANVKRGETKYSRAESLLRFSGSSGVGLAFDTNFLERMRIDAAGNVGIGVTPSAWVGRIAVDMPITATISAANLLDVGSNWYANAGGFRYKFSGAATVYEISSTGHAWYGAPVGVANAVFSWTKILEVAKDYTLALQSATTNAGTGISFPATQVPSADPNTLDDYEEGTFTPGIYFGGNNVGITYAIQKGKYVKVGKKVTATGAMRLTSKGSSTGSASFLGLPFTSDGDTEFVTPVTLRFASLTATATDVCAVYNA